MKARWILHWPSDTMPKTMIGYTIIAQWWPGKYHLVMTCKWDTDDELSTLMKSISQRIGASDTAPAAIRYFMNVYRCNKDGAADSMEHPLYQQQFTDISAAREAHKNAVESLAHGKVPS